MDPMPLLGPTALTEIGHRRLVPTPMIKEFPEPLPVKRPTTKVASRIQWPAKPLLPCGTKGCPAILLLIPSQRIRMKTKFTKPLM
jgi:hypothetical protein